MRDLLRSMVIVSVLTVAVWVFAEAESLSSREIGARVDFSVSQANRDLMRARLDPEFDGAIRLELRGSRSALDRVQRELEGSIEITPSLAGRTADGPFTLFLDEYIQNIEVVRAANVEVIAVRPRSISGEIVELRTLDEVPVVVELDGLEVEAAPTVNPSTVSLRVPASLGEERMQGLYVVASLSDEQRTRIVPGEMVSLTARLALPPDVASLGDVQLLSAQSAAVGLTVRSTRVNATVEAVLWTTVPTTQAGRYEFAVDPIQSVFDVEVVGPADAVAMIESRELPIVAVVALDATDLLEAAVSREVRWFVREGAALGPLPPGVEVRSDRASVTIEIVPLENQ